MKVKLRRTWFGPDGCRHRKGTHEAMPDEWFGMLPSDAKVYDMEPAPAVPLIVKDLDEPDELIENDLGRAAGDAEQAIRDEAEADSPYKATDEGDDNDDD